MRCDATGACTTVSGATTAMYVLTSADVGDTVASVITATDKEGQQTPATSTAVGPIAPAPPPTNLTPPTLAGQPQSGQTIGVNVGTWTNPDNLVYSYSWQRCDPSSGACASIDNQSSPYYTLTDDDVGMDIAATVVASNPDRQTASATTMQVGPVGAAQPLTGIQKIQHVVIIMQENRSFDSYFGTFPGAEGIPAGVCVPFVKGPCAASYHDTNDLNNGGPHGMPGGIKDIDGGKMDGFALSGSKFCGIGVTACGPCSQTTQTKCVDVMGYHDYREIPNYWTYAQDFTLQDHLFESVNSYSGPAHLYGVSGWSALCSSPTDPSTCTSNASNPAAPTTHGTYAWTDITYLMHNAGVSWGYYVDKRQPAGLPGQQLRLLQHGPAGCQPADHLESAARVQRRQG